MTAERIHSWHSGGGGETFVNLTPGAYELRSNYPSADGLRVLSGALPLVHGPGKFSIAVEGPIVIQFGSLPRIIELWRQVASGGAGAQEVAIAAAAIPPASNAATSAPETAP